MSSDLFQNTIYVSVVVICAIMLFLAGVKFGDGLDNNEITLAERACIEISPPYPVSGVYTASAN